MGLSDRPSTVAPHLLRPLHNPLLNGQPNPPHLWPKLGVLASSDVRHSPTTTTGVRLPLAPVASTRNCRIPLCMLVLASKNTTLLRAIPQRRAPLFPFAPGCTVCPPRNPNRRCLRRTGTLGLRQSLGECLLCVAGVRCKPLALAPFWLLADSFGVHFIGLHQPPPSSASITMTAIALMMALLYSSFLMLKCENRITDTNAYRRIFFT
ncbi:hypothetical protein IF1G_07018 [Cordyceps javanica]|uniref:Uncharacterized protein n=1 Tax=Cordyceps javanica TaxID=43265 RepID=A0A545UXE4_9HYPO|nr:hypothetical protein IF1G_07018 [Cordyceps javanica]